MVSLLQYLLLISATLVFASFEEEEAPLKNNSVFIDTVHELGSILSKNIVVPGHQVVYSPFSVVNALIMTKSSLVKNHTKLREDFKEAITFMEDEMAGVRRVSVAFTDDELDPTGLETEVVKPFPVDLNEISAKYKNVTGFPPSPYLTNQIDPTTKTVFLSSLTLKASWDGHFQFGQSRYSRYNKFYLNETHVTHTGWFSCTGDILYTEIKELEASIAAIKLKDSIGTYMLFIRPDNKSGLESVSDKLHSLKISTIFDQMTPKLLNINFPRINIENDLVFTIADKVQVIQSGSIHFGQNGFFNRFDNYQGIRDKYTNKNKKFRNLKAQKFFMDRPFAFMIYEKTKVGVFNYGEVLIPTPEPKRPQEARLSQAAKGFSDSINSFGQDLYGRVRLLEEKNFVTAPLTLTGLIASFAKGADEKSRRRIFEHITFPAVWEKRLQEILFFSYPGRNVTIENSTKIIVESGVEVEPTFEDKIKDFDTEFERVTFRRKKDFINSHLSKNFNTLGAVEFKLKGLLRTNRLVQSTFKLNERDSVNVTYMEYFGKVYETHLGQIRATVYNVPLGNGKQTLMIFNPYLPSSLHEVEESLSEVSVSEIKCKLRGKKKKVRVPLFSVSTHRDILPELDSLDILHPDMEYPGIGKDVQITKVVQNVAVEVSPLLSTRNDRRYKTKRPNYSHSHTQIKNYKKKRAATIKIDKPFIFYVLDDSSGILAAGRVMDPSMPKVEPVVPGPITLPVSTVEGEKPVDESVAKPPVTAEPEEDLTPSNPEEDQD